MGLEGGLIIGGPGIMGMCPPIGGLIPGAARGKRGRQQRALRSSNARVTTIQRAGSLSHPPGNFHFTKRVSFDLEAGCDGLHFPEGYSQLAKEEPSSQAIHPLLTIFTVKLFSTTQKRH